MAKTIAALEAELRESKKRSAEEIEKLRKANEDLLKEQEKIKAEAKKRREGKATEQVLSVKARLDAEPHRWVKVFYVGMDEGVDFGFMYEGIQFWMISGKPIELAESVIKHLKGCGFPIAKLKQGVAGQPVKVEGFHHNYNVVECEAPPQKAAG